MKSFNLALLSKQGWRLLKHPTSLASRVLHQKYYPMGEFLNAKLGHKPSYVWRSILAGRDLLSAGLIWRIGTGQQTMLGFPGLYPTEFIPLFLSLTKTQQLTNSSMRVAGTLNSFLTFFPLRKLATLYPFR